MINRIDSFKNSELFRKKIHNLIPGGAHTYSKGDDQFPELAPAAIKYGKGAYVWDVDDNKFLDCSMGLTSVSLGHAFESVISKISEELIKGVNFQRPSIIELEMAEKFLKLVPQHDMIKFGKNGSLVITAAIKLARAKTGRKLVAFPSDHPFYSYDDWFIGKTACSAGVPDEHKSLSVTFKGCSIESLQELFEKYPNQIACVITEPERSSCYNCNCGTNPETFLKSAIDLSHKHGALFIQDEMITGFKSSFPGSITKFNTNADMATWGKGIANGFSFCALTGKKEIMELGGIQNEGSEKVFLISTTHGGETTSIAAGLATIEVFQNNDVIAHNQKIGNLIIENCNQIIKENNLEQFVSLTPCNWFISFSFFDYMKEINLSYRTLFLQEMIKRGVLFQGIFVPCYSHCEEDVFYFLEVFKESLNVYSKALNAKTTDGLLIGKSIKPVFRKYL